MAQAEFSNYTEWFADCHKAIDANYDDIHLFTGEEGRYKSRKMRTIFRSLDPTFTVDRIHFNQDDFLEQAVTLEPGQSIVLDEFRGHKRLAMHGDRLEFLDFLKECRGLRLHMGIGFPQVTSFEGDIVYKRIRWWVHSPSRPIVLVHRRSAESKLGSDGKPIDIIRFQQPSPLPFPDDTADPMRKAYEAKKDIRMRDRAQRYRETHKGQDPTPAPLLASAASVLRDAVIRKPAPVNQVFQDQVMHDIKKAIQ